MSSAPGLGKSESTRLGRSLHMTDFEKNLGTRRSKGHKKEVRRTVRA